MDYWEEKVDQSPPCTEYRKKQSSWDDPLVEQTFNSLLAATVDPSSKARLLATATKESRAWLNDLPAGHLGTKLDDDSIRIATGLRLGANIVEEHTCVCGLTVNKLGHHGLSCRRSGRRISRHHAANETIRHALVSGGVPAVLEPVGVRREDGKRPEGMTLIPWEGGHPLLWDFTSCDTVACSNCVTASRGAGVVACNAEGHKRRKYSSLSPTYVFAPACIESMDAWGESAKSTKLEHVCGRIPVNPDQLYIHS